MAFCRDQSVSALKGFGYNVVRYPSASLRPHDLIGLLSGEVVYLGRLNQLINRSSDTLPKVSSSEPAPDINGKKSNKLKLNLGVALLSDVLGAMGGNVGGHIGYTDARYLQFQYVGVTTRSTIPIEVGNYLKDAEVDFSNPICNQFVLGDGRILLVTKIAQSKRLLVRYERQGGQTAAVDLKALGELVGGRLKVENAGTDSAMISFEGSRELTFGFQCWEIGIGNGVLELNTVQAGSVFLDSETPSPVILNPEGLLQSVFCDPLLGNDDSQIRMP